MLAQNSMPLATTLEEPRTEPTRVVLQCPEDLLQASRRLDWRFLLPDPSLERVAYIGPKQGSLVASLKLLASTLKVFSGSEVHSGDYTRYDVVVATNPAYHQLRLATDLVRPGGYLYVEACSPFSSRQQLGRLVTRAALRRPRLWNPRDHIQVLKQLGMDQAEAYWFWPNWEAGTKIIPLEDPTALRQAFALDSRGKGLKGQLLALSKRWLMQSVWLSSFVPYYGIVAW